MTELGGLDEQPFSPEALLDEDATRLVMSTLEQQIERGPRWWRSVSRPTDSPFPMLVFDRDSGAVIDANHAAVRAFGWSREELLTRLVTDVFPTLGADEPASVRGRATQWMGPWSVRRRDGSTFFAEVGMMDGRSEEQPSMIMLVTPRSPSGETDGEPQATRAWDETASSPPLLGRWGRTRAG